ncbi:MAG TPA: S41 family peptidase, partial [Acidobacteriaceae bacterium]|nr:S41 family peptidase [Acidobacteriaceae bacterium]
SRMPLLLRWLRGEWKADPPRIERFGDGVVYARLPEFNSSNYKNVSFASLPKPEPGDRVLIVDLRNNGGGSAGFGDEMLKGWIDESATVKFNQIGHQLNSSCLFPALKWNSSDTDPRGATGPLPTGYREILQHFLDLMAQPYPPDCPRSVQTTPVQWTYLQRHFHPRAGEMRIIALVNSMCGSDCEFMTSELASLPQTIVAGTNTYGIAGFIQPGYSVLPHTGLPYRIALGRENIYGDNRSFDGSGLDVDVVIPQTDDLGPKELRELAEVIARQ